MHSSEELWTQCVRWLEAELPDKDVATWIRPLHPIATRERLLLLAPNRIVLDRVRQDYLGTIRRAVRASAGESLPEVELAVGSAEVRPAPVAAPVAAAETPAEESPVGTTPKLDSRFTFTNFIEGKSNAQARAAAQYVAESPGGAYNPLLIYGPTGLGKTHLMHSIGNEILRRSPQSKVAYLFAEQWMSQYVTGVRHGRWDDIKSYYRSVDALLIDDIQFFAYKEKTQEEFFHAFNSLIDSRKQIVLTCDRYPKDVDGIDERLKSRFTWGLSVAVETPDLETRIAILQSKAEQSHDMKLPDDVAMFVAQRVRSSVRDLEGALHRLAASARFRGEKLTIDFARTTLKDMLAAYERQVTIENIKRKVADYYNIRVSDLASPRRTRTLARPRQIAMALAKELTQHSLPEIGESFGKDHTTVLHACRKVVELREQDLKIREDYENLQRQLGF